MNKLLLILLVGCAGIPKEYQSDETNQNHVGWGSVSFVDSHGIMVVAGNLAVDAAQFDEIVSDTQKRWNCVAPLNGTVVLFRKLPVVSPFDGETLAEAMSWQQIAKPFKWNAIVGWHERLCESGLSHEIGHMLNVECRQGKLNETEVESLTLNCD